MSARSPSRSAGVSMSRRPPGMSTSVDASAAAEQTRVRLDRRAALAARASSRRGSTAGTPDAFVVARRCRQARAPPPRAHEPCDRRGVDARLIDEQHQRGSCGARSGGEARAQRRRHAFMPAWIRDDARAAARAPQHEPERGASRRRRRRSAAPGAGRRARLRRRAAAAGDRGSGPVASVARAGASRRPRARRTRRRRSSWCGARHVATILKP